MNTQLRQSALRLCQAARTAMGLTLIAVATSAAAAEPVNSTSPLEDHAHDTSIPMTTLMSPCLATTGTLDQVRHEARNLTNTTAAADDERLAKVIDVELHDARVPVAISELIELDGLPIVKLSDESERPLYFGVSFDGVIGLHGKL